MKVLPVLGAALGLAAVVSGGTVARPALTDALLGSTTTTPAPATKAVANTTSSSADRQIVVVGPDPVGIAEKYPVDRSLLGYPNSGGRPSVNLPKPVLAAPAPGFSGGVFDTDTSALGSNTTTWTPQKRVDGAIRHVQKTSSAMNSYIVIPAETGDLHLLCAKTKPQYYVDTSNGEWRVYRYDGGTKYDIYYRFTQYDRSPTSNNIACQ